MKIEGSFGGRAWWGGVERGLASVFVVVLVTIAVGFGGGAGCRYDYNSLMGSPDGGAASGGATSSGGTSGSGGRSATGSGGTGAGAEAGGAGGAVATGGSQGTGGRAAMGGAGTAGMSGAGGSGTGTSGGAAGGAAGAGSSGNGGAASGGTSSGGAGGAAVGGAGATSGGGAGGGPADDPDLVLWYRFEESGVGGNGATVPDSATATGTPHPGTLATFGTGGDAVLSMLHQVGSHSVSLTANGSAGGGYVAIPSLQDLAPNAITLALWVQVTTAQRWQRVFDVGDSTATNMALTTQDGTDSVRFVIRVQGGPGEQIINTTAKLTLSVWHHLAVVLRAGSPYTGEIFVDGVSAGTNPAMTLHPADLGATVNNFLGRSQFDVDPYWSGLLDDFRVYRRALTAGEVTALTLQR